MISGVPCMGQRIGGGGGHRVEGCVLSLSQPAFWYWGVKTPKCTDKKNTYTARASEASERLRNIYYQDSKYICLHIQSMHFPLLMVWRYKRYYTNKTLQLRKKIYEYGSERSERAQTIFTFSHAKTAISFNILLVLQILCLRNIFPLSLV